jgi:tetratricopeptide (TPR) repeat protein
MAEGDAEAKALQIEVTVAQALAQVARNQPDLALHDLTRLRDENPGSAVVRVGIAKALVAKRDYDGAIGELQKAVAAEPGSAEAQYQLGYVQHVFKGNASAALPAYEKAVAADPGNATYRTSLGAALVGVKQFDRSVEELKKVTESPGYDKPDAWIYLGQAQVGAKRYKEALPPLEKAAAIAPNNDMPYALMAWAYFGLKDAEAFKKNGGKARALGHKEPTLLDYLKRVEGGEPIK